jgi:hypothetical protein
MPIAAQTSVPSGFPAAFDTLLIRQFLISQSRLVIVLSRYGQVGVGGVEQVGSGQTVVVEDIALADADTATLIAGVFALVRDYQQAKGLPVGNPRVVMIRGSVNRESVKGSLRILGEGTMVDFPDVYAEAAGDAVLASLMAQFLALVATWNASKKVV